MGTFVGPSDGAGEGANVSLELLLVVATGVLVAPYHDSFHSNFSMIARYNVPEVSRLYMSCNEFISRHDLALMQLAKIDNSNEITAKKDLAIVGYMRINVRTGEAGDG